MANRERDVSLVIRAKEQSTKAIAAVEDALNDLKKAQESFGASATKGSSLVERLKASYSNLGKELRSLAALDKVAVNMDKAAGAVGRLDAEVKATAASQVQLSEAVSAAAANTARLKAAADEAGAAYARQRAVIAGLTAEQKKEKDTVDALRASRDNLKKTFAAATSAADQAQRAEGDLNKQLSRSQAVLNDQQQALAEANAELSQIATLAGKASAALGGVEATQSAVARASARATAEMERTAAALQQVKSASGDRRLLQGGNVLTDDSRTNAVQALKVYREAEAELARLASVMESAGQVSEEMRRDFDLASAAAAKSADDYRRMRDALNEATAARRAAKASGAATSTSSASGGTTSGAGISGVPTAVPNSMREATVAGNALRDAFKGIYGESRTAMNLFQRMRGEILSLTASFVGLYAAIEGVRSVIDTAIKYQATFNSLMVVTGGNSSKARAEMEYLQAEAARLGISFTTLATNYATFADAAQGANLSMNDTRRVFKAISEAGVVMNVSVEDMQGIFKALGQIMSKGKVQAEELRGQLGDRMTGAFRLMSQALGVTTGQLDKMLQQGQVLADRSTIVNFADTVSARYGKQLPEALQGANAEIGRFQNNLVQAQKNVADAGFLDAFIASLRKLNEWFQSDDGKRFFEGIGIALGKLVTVLPPVIENIGAIVSLFQVFAGLKLAQVLLSLTPAFLSVGSSVAGMRTAFLAARAEVMAMTVAMQINSIAATGAARVGYAAATAGLLTFRGAIAATIAGVRALTVAIAANPIGLLITGLSVLASFILPGMLTSTDKLSEALNTQNDIMEKVRAAYAKGADSLVEFKKNLDGVSESTIIVELAKVQKAFADLQDQARKPFADDNLAHVFTGFSDDLVKVRQKLYLVTDAFQNNRISAEDYLKQVDDLVAANPRLVSENSKLIDGLRETAKKAVDAQKKTEVYQGLLAYLRGTATDAQQALLGFADAADTANASLTTTSIDAYAQSLRALRDSVPSLKAFDDYQSKQATALKDYKDKVQELWGRDNPLSARLLDPSNAGELAKLFGPSKLAKLQELVTTFSQAQAAFTDTFQKSMTSTIDTYLEKVARIESGGKNLGRHGTASTASGLYGFTDRTFENSLKTFFPQVYAAIDKATLDAYKRDPAWQKKLAEALTQEIDAALRTAKLPATDANRYLAHLLGAPDAIKVLQANPTTPLAGLIGKDSVKANPKLMGGNATAGSIIGYANTKINGASVAANSGLSAEDAKLANDRAEAQRKFNEQLAAEAAQRTAIVDSEGLAYAQQKAVAAAQKQADEQHLVLSKAQIEEINTSVAAEYKRVKASEAQKQIMQAQAELASATNRIETESEFIARKAREDKIDLLTEEGRKWEEIQKQIYAVTKAEHDRSQFDNGVSTLQSRQRSILDQIGIARDNGDAAQVKLLKEQLAQTNAALVAATEASLAFYRALDPATNPNAAGAIANLEGLKQQTLAYRDDTAVTASQVNDQFAQAATGGLDSFIQKVMDGRAVIKSLGESLRQSAADILTWIAKLIEQAAILKALEKTPIGKYVSGAINSLNGVGMKSAADDLKQAGLVVGGAAAAITASALALKSAGAALGGAGAGGAQGGSSTLAAILTSIFTRKAPVHHRGGVVGAGTAPTRNVFASAFANAARYHGGGVAGLKPDEVPAILQRGEVVFTKGQMSALGGAGAASKAVELKNVNVFDASDMLAHALADTAGQQVLMNYINQNRTSIKGVLR
ncbi:hypothetical protein AEAC466_04270 [Asticcacaulis sp. AC466]|uniref:tape measure protein n=1 Tax=Asticcacaulis sp. AC466 TaxID=1282362 RepID=UPI0003C3C792|nr:tape measure protein [Asticcacaulis sp. AC466]ESQ85389.1 hypothetical protein AEAC466_04270 [Asticcacaulis sp. AC466]